MPLILNKSFTSLINHLEATITQDEAPIHYVGMGNPDSEVLIVGKEIALDKKNPDDAGIMLHELDQNIKHWYDIISNYSHLHNSFDPNLLTRKVPLNGFNPFSPMLFTPTAARVIPRKRHTYYIIERLISKGSIGELFHEASSTFHHCFLTEISHIPHRNNADYNPLSTESIKRLNFIQSSPFFKSFKTVIIHVGVNNKNYIGARGTIERYEKIRTLFNAGIINKPTTVLLDKQKDGKEIQADIFINPDEESKIIVCNQLSGSAGWTNESIVNLNKSL